MSTIHNPTLSGVAQTLHTVSSTLTQVAEQIKSLEERLGIQSENPSRYDTQQRYPAPAELEPPVEDEKPQRVPWAWISGEETRLYARELREAGGRWSSKRSAWYFTEGIDAVPDHITKLPNLKIKISY